MVLGAAENTGGDGGGRKPRTYDLKPGDNWAKRLKAAISSARRGDVFIVYGENAAAELHARCVETYPGKWGHLEVTIKPAPVAADPHRQAKLEAAARVTGPESLKALERLQEEAKDLVSHARQQAAEAKSEFGKYQKLADDVRAEFEGRSAAIDALQTRHAELESATAAAKARHDQVQAEIREAQDRLRALREAAGDGDNGADTATATDAKPTQV